MKKNLFVFLIIFCSNINVYAETADYKYDNSGRLIEITYSSGKKVVYTYDTVGNRIKMTVNNTDGSEIVDIEFLAPILSLILDDEE